MGWKYPAEFRVKVMTTLLLASTNMGVTSKLRGSEKKHLEHPLWREGRSLPTVPQRGVFSRADALLPVSLLGRGFCDAMNTS